MVVSLFDYAEKLGIDVPTSCRKQGKCKECMVEVVEGMDCLSSVTSPEQHLKASFASPARPTSPPPAASSLPHHAARPHAHRAPGVRPAGQ